MLTDLIRRKVLFVAIGVAAFAGPGSSALAQLEESGAYTDKIYLKNGDVITGNLKELDRGKLRFKTRTMDTVYINWVDIKSVDSDKYLRIEKADGSFNYGVIQSSDLENELVIEDRGREVEIPILSVSTLQPIRVQESLWRRIEGDMSAGIDYKKASDILLVNLSTNLRFREEKYELAAAASWNETSRVDDQNSSRAELGVNYTRFLPNRWFWRGSAGLEQNEELGLDLRTIVAATAGRYLVRTPIIGFELNAGLAGNWEDRADGTTTTSAEGLIQSSFSVFKHTLPITRLTANVNIFPGITESGRTRVNSDITLRNEIVRSVFWDLSFYSTYDNRPPEGASKEDYGIVTSIGASF